MQQTSSANSISKFERPEYLPVGFLRLTEIHFPFGQSDLGANFKGQRVPGAQQDSVLCRLNNHAMEVVIVFRIEPNVLLGCGFADRLRFLSKLTNPAFQ